MRLQDPQNVLLRLKKFSTTQVFQGTILDPYSFPCMYVYVELTKKNIKSQDVLWGGFPTPVKVSSLFYWEKTVILIYNILL